ncbi:triphosphoribosyl-dephospho-CoA synthase MdcB [Acinetobacter sp. ANC 4558]|uniref:triphosphoribosyl-dephospho-CoA synthase MdcB n=1 Tax=Acinetobacter sp. ANC 4558 TaxID=1977876 RepID=UPI000A32C001|nr:triphosphoribosyl-dephospho-CoA synthase MdcB [Acinetobacter sp. ANC 4558]OTG84114.1 triphosphoribosyl-dephospho-CoA synthase MdcB [Acinetobacter sp. ANC 4558]
MQTQLLQFDTHLDVNAFAHLIDQLAQEALLEEVSLNLKPGLVCRNSRGSHTDMDHKLFLLSINALKGYCHDQFLYGYHAVDFERIRQRGLLAEQDMLKETKDINTHKGAIFNLGFACAAIGKCVAENRKVKASEISKVLQLNWNHKLLHHLKRHQSNHGQQMREKYGITGAIEEVASGFITVREIGLPCFKRTYLKTQDIELSSIQTLFSLIAHVKDTNIVWRGGLSSLLIVQDMAKDFLQAGGVLQVDWRQQAQQICDYFVQQRLSPGGSADLLGVTLFLYKVEHEFRNII